MNTLIAYCSTTGNTKKLANQIHDAWNGKNEIKKISEVVKTTDYDMIFVGFPINNFAPPREARLFLKKLPKEQRIVLFATHAVPIYSDLNTKQKEKCLKYASHLNVLDFYTCRGELSEDISEFLLNSDNLDFQSFGKMRPETIGHPTAKELEELKLRVNVIQQQLLF